MQSGLRLARDGRVHRTLGRLGERPRPRHGRFSRPNEPRAIILEAANKGRDHTVKPYTMSRINQAVFKCRQRALVSDVTLQLAGFNPRRAR